jgi:hypothetical protein
MHSVQIGQSSFAFHAITQLRTRARKAIKPYLVLDGGMDCDSQPAAAQRVALKMGRRLRGSSVTYRFRYGPSYWQSGSDRLAGGPF